MDSEEDDIWCLTALSIVFVGVYLQMTNRLKRRWWERPHLGPTNRRKFSQATILKTFSLNDSEQFFKYLRFTPDQFKKLEKLIGPSIEHHCFRETINPTTRLAISLRFLATGESQRSLALNYRLGDSTVHNILKETLTCIPLALKRMVFPSTDSDSLRKIADGFWTRWDFPHCCGCFDGKHIRIKKPYGAGSEFYNYKDYHSVVLLAACDHGYKFILVDIGSEGRNSDGGIFRNSKIGRMLLAKEFPLPSSDFVKNGPYLPYYFLGDAAFGLTEFMITPYARSNAPLPEHKEIFNYRQSRARRVIENAFGILASVFRIFKTEIDMGLDNIDNVIMSCVCLHNFRLIENEKMGIGLPVGLVDSEINGQLVKGSWRTEHDNFDQIAPQTGRHAAMTAVNIREELSEFFTSEDGQVPWQYSILDRKR